MTDQLFSLGAIVVDAAVAGVLAAGVVAALVWGGQRGRFALAGAATFAGFVAWNLTLNATHARGFNTDAPVVGLSWADAGSGVLAFVVTAAALTLVERREPAARVVGAAALAGVAAAFVDLFVL